MFIAAIPKSENGKESHLQIVVQSRSCVWFFATAWTATQQASLSFTVYLSLLKLMSMSQWYHPTISSSAAPFSALNLSQYQGLFQEVSSSHQWPKYWSFSFSTSPSNEYSGLISFRIDWFDLFAVQGTLKSHLQHHSWKVSILQHSAFFIVHLSHPYMITGKTIALTRQTFISKVMSLVFNTLSRLVITFLPRSKSLLILWLRS